MWLANVPRSQPREYAKYRTWDLLKAHRIAQSLGEGDEVLDIGCGDGHRLAELGMFRRIHARGIDLTAHEALPGVTLSAYDGRNVPFDRGEFDVTLLCYVLHHLTRERAAELLAEAVRVTRRKVIVLEDSLPAFGGLYRLRNWLHRSESDLAYAGPTYESPGDESMFLTHAQWSSFFRELPGVKDVHVESLTAISRYAHHTLIEIDL